MKLAEALAIVYELADENKLSPREAENEELVLEAAKQYTALAIVHDFIVNGEWENDIYPRAVEFVDFENFLLRNSLPPGCSFYIGRWEGGGCYGIILGYNYEDDDRNFHTVRFSLKDWKYIQRLKRAVEDAAQRCNGAKSDIGLYHAAATHTATVREYLDALEGYIV